MTVKEISVKIKSEDRKYQQDFLEYNDFTVSDDDTTIKRLVGELKGSIQGPLEDPEFEVVIKIKWS